MDIQVSVDGRGQSFKTKLTVDPKEKMEATLRAKTHFWKNFMMHGNPKCMVSVNNKNDEDSLVPPDQFD